MRVKRLRSVRALSTGGELAYEKRTTIIDRLANPDPLGEITISVPEQAIDQYATVLALEFEGDPTV